MAKLNFDYVECIKVYFLGIDAQFVCVQNLTVKFEHEYYNSTRMS